MNFLYDLPRLKEFTMRYTACDETALECIANMKYLQRFQYPVADMKIYQGCPKIQSIGIDSSRVEDFSALEGKETITDLMFYNLKTEKRYEEQLQRWRNIWNLVHMDMWER